MTEEKHLINITINGVLYKDYVSPDLTLLKYIREHLGLTGTKDGCNNGNCGACTVLMDGKAVYSCLILVVHANDAHITTIEGLGTPDELHPLQKAFIEEGAVQCGFCTPGMIMATKALLDKNNHPSEEEIKVALSGNLCRCTGYEKNIRAIKKAAMNQKRE